MSGKYCGNILHFFSKTKDRTTNDNTNTLLNRHLISQSRYSLSLSDIIRKNILTGGFRKNAKYEEKMIQTT